MTDIQYQELTEDILYKIQKYYENKGVQLRFSLFALFQWNYYKTQVSYLFDGEDYFFFLNFDNNSLKIYDNLKPGCFPGVVIFTKEFINEKYIEKLKNLTTWKHCNVFFSEALAEDFINKLGAEPFDSFPPKVGNYVYDTKQFIGFPGKKMQKKRNFLNGFFRDNPNFEIEKINVKNLDIAIKFINSITNRQYEIDSYGYIYNSILKYEHMMKGSILKVNGKIIGATMGIINGDFYEIVIEKALVEYRGSYQALISENLKLNDIKTTYIDRQDDLLDANLIKSKESYKPIAKVMFVAYKI